MEKEKVLSFCYHLLSFSNYVGKKRYNFFLYFPHNMVVKYSFLQDWQKNVQESCTKKMITKMCKNLAQKCDKW